MLTTNDSQVRLFLIKSRDPLSPCVKSGSENALVTAFGHSLEPGVRLTQPLNLKGLRFVVAGDGNPALTSPSLVTGQKYPDVSWPLYRGK